VIVLNISGRIYQFLSYISDIIILNILWLLVSLFGMGITVGASTTAIYSVMLKMVDPEKDYYVVRDFFKAFKKNFVQSTIIWIIMLLISFILYFNYRLAYSTESIFLFILFYLASFLTLITAVYLFPVVAKFEASTKDYFISTFLIANKHLLTTILILSSLVGSIFILMKLSSLLVLVIPGIYFLSTSYHIRKILRVYENNLM
jgi:uncharacterized membrane protein YesL